MNKKEKDLLGYFIKRSDERFDALEQKIDALTSFKFMFAGGLIAVNAIITLLIAIYN